MVIPWNDTLDIDFITHINDDSGNTYILSYVNAFDTINGVVGISDGNDYGNVIIKIDKDNKIVWKKFYLSSDAESVTHLYLRGNSLYLPFSNDAGIIGCPKTTVGIESSILGILLINTASGDTIKTNFYAPVASCGGNTLQTIFSINEKSNIIIHNDSGSLAGQFYQKPLDQDLGLAGLKPLTTLTKFYRENDNEITSFTFDSFSNNFYTTNEYGIEIFDTAWHIVDVFPYTSYNIPFIYIANVITGYNSNFMAFNFAANYDPASGITTYYTLVIDKKGNLISLDTATSFDDLLVTEDNNIWAISAPITQGVATDTAQIPLTLTQMDLYQNIKRKLNFGRPGVIPAEISLIQDSSIVITGTYYLSRLPNASPQPDKIYYCKLPLKDIPVISQPESVCNSVNIYPNPASSVVHVSNIDFAASSVIDIYNMLGQKVASFLNNSKKISYDISALPNGAYFFKILSDNNVCVKKILKN